jgi:hypothetical protein
MSERVKDKGHQGEALVKGSKRCISPLTEALSRHAA